MTTSWLWFLGFEIDCLQCKLNEKTLVEEKTIICTPNLYKHFLLIHVTFCVFSSNFFWHYFSILAFSICLTTFIWGAIWLGNQDNSFSFSFGSCLIFSTLICHMSSIFKKSYNVLQIKQKCFNIMLSFCMNQQYTFLPNFQILMNKWGLNYFKPPIV